MKKIILCTALAVAIGTPIFTQEKTAEDPVVMTIAERYSFIGFCLSHRKTAGRFNE